MTLVEMMFSLGIGTLVFAILFSLLSQPIQLWHTSLALWHLDSQSRLVRETLLRGIDSQYGLREASRSSVQIFPGQSEQVDWIDFDVNTGDFDYRGIHGRRSSTVTCRIVQTGNDRLAARTVPGSGTPKPILRDPVGCDKLGFSLNGDQITVDYTLSIQVAGETHTRRTRFSVPLINN